MTTPSKQLSPEKCKQAREGGALKLIVSFLHEHTFEPPDQSESNFNIETFYENFNQKSKRRQGLSLQLRAIISDESELKILDSIEAIRRHTEQLYDVIGKGDAADYTEMPVPPQKALSDLAEFAIEAKSRPVVELFGGALAVVDHLRAHSRFCGKFRMPGRAVRPRLRDFEVFQALGLFTADLQILHNLLARRRFRKDIQAFLSNSRSFHEILLNIIKNAYAHNQLQLFQLCCKLINILKDNSLGFFVARNTPYMRDCGIIKTLTQLLSHMKDPETLYWTLFVLDTLSQSNHRNTLEFRSVEGSIDKLIDVLEYSKEKDEDFKNADWFDEQRIQSARMLYNLNTYLLIGANNEYISTIYKNREIVPILVHHLNRTGSIEYVATNEVILQLLEDILTFCKQQREDFLEMAKTTMERFELSGDDYTAGVAQRIMEIK